MSDSNAFNESGTDLATRPGVIAELALAGTHLGSGAVAARALNALALAQAIDAVGLQANDLMRMQLRGLRRAARLTQAELARRIGCRPALISEFETGRRPIAPEFVLPLVQALGGADNAGVAREWPLIIRQVRTAVAGEETSAFEVVASGISMEPTIRHGDKLLVSRDIKLAAGRIIVAIHEGVWIVKRLALRDGALVLRSDNANEEVALAAVDVQGTVVELRRMV